MQAALHLKTYTLGAARYSLFQPNQEELKSHYQQRLQHNTATPFPYWGKVWPAALTLAHYLHQNPQWVRKKRVLEIAAGLGLPSLVAAPFASSLVCTDYDDDAVEAMQQTMKHHGYSHAKAQLFNWKNPPHYPLADVLLLSDVNYEPSQFEALYQLMHHYYNAGTHILLCSPQRLMAKAFIESIKWMVHETISPEEDELACKILVLQKN